MLHVVEAEMGGTEANGGKHGIVLPKISVGCDMDGFAVGSVFLEDVFGGFVAEK